MTITIIIILPLKSNLWFFFDIKNIYFSNLITIIIIFIKNKNNTNNNNNNNNNNINNF
jgi:hypothetical protein